MHTNEKMGGSKKGRRGQRSLLEIKIIRYIIRPIRWTTQAKKKNNFLLIYSNSSGRGSLFGVVLFELSWISPKFPISLPYRVLRDDRTDIRGSFWKWTFICVQQVPVPSEPYSLTRVHPQKSNYNPDFKENI